MANRNEFELSGSRFSIATWRFLLTFLLCVVTPALSHAAQDDVLLDGLDRYVEQALTDWSIPGVAIAVVKDDKVIYSKGFGVKESGKTDPVDDRTLFQIGSLTKSVTGTAFAILVDEGKLKWDDKVVDHLPWFRLKDPALTRQISIRDLLAHKTGLRDAWYLYYAPMDTKETIRRMRLIDTYSSFRQDAEYSNLMYAVAGEIVTTVSGMPWEQFVKTRVLDPLGMKASGTSAYDFWDHPFVAPVFLGAAPAGSVSAADANVDNVAMPHRQLDGGEINPVPWQYYDNASAAGTVVSNASDMARWMRFHLSDGTLDGKRLIEKQSAKELHAPQMLLPSTWAMPSVDGASPEPGTLSYGFGWIRSRHRGVTLLSHGGGIIGFPAHIAIVPEHHLGIVVLANGTNGTNVRYPMHRQISFHVIDQLLDLPVHDWRDVYLKLAEQSRVATRQAEQRLEESRKKETQPSIPLKQFTGTYHDEKVGDINVELTDGRLRLFVSGKGMFSGVMEHWHDDTFRLNWNGVFKGFQSFVVFEFDASGAVNKMRAEHVGDFVPVVPAIVPIRDDSKKVVYEFNLKTPMRDGAMLSSDVYRPNKPGKFPVILIRTPYTKSSPVYVEQGKYWASHDYVFIVQDVRGRGDSDGEFIPFVHEAADGDDAINWAADQVWSTGKIGMLGNSYLGWTQLYAATTNNPHLAAMIPTVAPPDPDRNFPMDAGVLMPAGAAWLVSLDGHVNQNLTGLDVAGAYSLKPFSGFDQYLGRNIKTWQDWVSHPVRDAYWEGVAYQKKLLKTEIPTLYISGWYDDVLVGTTENFINMTRRPGTHAVQQMMIGPWAHAANTTRKLGDVDFGPDALVDLPAIQLRWFDHWLKGIVNGVEQDAAVRIFVMGSNRWVDEQQWPIARTNYVKYYLHSMGEANTRLGDGTLSTSAPIDDEKSDRFVFDPDNPVPYEDNFDWRQVGGPDDYREIELRKDILVYTSPVFEKPITVCGPLKVRLFAASSARDTDWTVKVLDVHPDGFVQRLNDGIVRARFRNGSDREEFLTPGKMEEYEIQSGSTSQRFLAGHRLRLEISSSAFGKYAVNLNGGGNPATESDVVVARQTVFHEPGRASYVLIPVVSDQGEDAVDR